MVCFRAECVLCVAPLTAYKSCLLTIARKFTAANERSETELELLELTEYITTQTVSAVLTQMLVLCRHYNNYMSLRTS